VRGDLGNNENWCRGAYLTAEKFAVLTTKQRRLLFYVYQYI